MIFEKYLMPDEMLKTFDCLHAEHIRSLGKSFVYSDIDNTLATYDDALPPENVVRWYDSMKKSGITVILISNNNEERVRPFADALGCEAYSKAKKPGVKLLREVMQKHGTDESSALLLGDQLLTDNAAAKRLGLYSVIVPPIRDKRNLFFRFKRMIEVPYVRKYKRMHNSGEQLIIDQQKDR